MVESRAATAGAAAESGQRYRCPHVAGPFWVDGFAYCWYLLRSTREFLTPNTRQIAPKWAANRMASAHVPKNSFTTFFVTARGPGTRATDATFAGK
jgi:hypothetical protein